MAPVAVILRDFINVFKLELTATPIAVFVKVKSVVEPDSPLSAICIELVPSLALADTATSPVFPGLAWSF